MTLQNLHTNIYKDLFIITPNWKQPRCSSIAEWKNKMEIYLHKVILLSNEKRMLYQAMKRHEYNINTYWQVKKVSLKSLHVV